MAKSSRKPDLPKITPLDGLTGPSFRERDQTAWEAEVVQCLLNSLPGGSAVKFQILDAEERLSSRRHLTLRGFAEECPDFPFFLEAKRYPHLAEKAPFSRIMEDFRHTPFGWDLDRLASELTSVDDVRSAGIVFRWPRLALIVYEKPGQIPFAPGTGMVWEPSKDVRIALEPFARFLARYSSRKHPKKSRE